MTIPSIQRTSRQLVPLVLLVISSSGVLQAQTTSAPVDTFAVRRGPSAPPSAATPAAVLGEAVVGEQFCNPLHCIVSTSAPAHLTALRSLEARGEVTLEPLPDAHRVFFQHATYDSQAGTFDRDFFGRLDLGASSSIGLFVVIFKSYPEPKMLEQLGTAGLVVLEPVQSMGYFVYGAQPVVAGLQKSLPFIYAVLQVSPGLKRFNLDAVSANDGGGPPLLQWPS